MILPAIPSRLLYKSIAVLALLGAGFVAKRHYDAKIAANALLHERIKADSAEIVSLNQTIVARNDVVIYFVGVAQKLRAKADSVGIVGDRARALSDSLRAVRNLTDTSWVTAVLEADSIVLALREKQIGRLEQTLEARDSVDAARDSREQAKDEKIAALERLNNDIAKTVAPKTTHLRDAAIGGAVTLAIGGVIALVAK